MRKTQYALRFGENVRQGCTFVESRGWLGKRRVCNSCAKLQKTRVVRTVVRWQSGKAEEAISDRQDMTAGPSPLSSPLSPGEKVETGTIPTFLAARRSHLSPRYNPPCSFFGGAKIT